MIERRQHLCFALEACDALGISRETLEHDLDGDRALQFRVAGTVHLAHAARAESVGDLVRADSRACGKCHACGRRFYLRSSLDAPASSRMTPTPCSIAMRVPNGCDRRCSLSRIARPTSGDASRGTPRSAPRAV